MTKATELFRLFSRIVQLFIAVPVLLAVFILASCSSTPPGYDADTTPGRNGEDYMGVGDSRSAVRLEAKPGGANITIDLLGLRGYRASSWAHNVWAPLRILTYPIDWGGYMISEHPWQSLALGAVAYEATTGGISGLFQSESKPPQPTAPTSPTNNPGQFFTIQGDGNTINYTSPPAAPE